MTSPTTLEILVQLRDEATKKMNEISGSLGNLQKHMEPAANASKAFGMALLGVGAAGVAGMGLALKAASDAEQSTVAFTTMLGSAEKAHSFIVKMKEFAAKTPFETSDISKAAQTMLSFGISVEKVMPYVQMIGDVAMGNKEKFSSLSLVFAQVQATGKLMGQDLLQMINQGFNPLQIMSEKTGKSMAQLKEEMEKGAISADMVTEAFKAATSEGGRFYGGMEAQSRTLAGVWSTLQDTFNEFLRSQGESIVPVAKEIVNMLSELINTTQNLINYLKENQIIIYGVVGAIVGGLTPALLSLGLVLTTSVIPAFLVASLALTPWLIGGAIIGGIVAGIVWLVQNWGMLSQKATEIWNGISGYLGGVWASITSTMTDTFNGISNTMTGIWNAIGEVFKYGVALLSGIMMTFLDLLFPSWRDSFQQVVDFCNVFFPIVQSVFDTSLNFLSNIWSKTWNTISSSFIGAFNTVKANLFEFSGWIIGIFNKIAKPVSDAWGAIWDGIKNRMMSAWDGIKDTMKSSINWIIEKINWFINQANMVASKGAGTLGISIPQLANIPMLAQGGIVTRPTIAMIGEAGPEAIIPLNKANNPGYGGVTININGGNFLGSNEDVAEYIGDLIIKKLQMNVAL